MQAVAKGAAYQMRRQRWKWRGEEDIFTSTQKPETPLPQKKNAPPGRFPEPRDSKELALLADKAKLA
ncbi:hypothetical protein ADM96_33605 [Burkholderia sp. ST111]|nr:hypothetical protein ADM96_33605 [Burkholderia sp. ST111]